MEVGVKVDDTACVAVGMDVRVGKGVMYAVCNGKVVLISGEDIKDEGISGLLVGELDGEFAMTVRD